jgi:N-acetylmuramoyl-L-alanine amidase
LIVIHCTELPDLNIAREYGERILYPYSGTGNSGHFYIERSGQIEQWVPIDRVAHHVKNFNKNSIGIELDNTGRYPEWFNSNNQLMKEPYPPEQLNSLLVLLKSLTEHVPSLSSVSGHSVLDTALIRATDDSSKMIPRKQDPGPMFPWKKILKKTSLDWFEPEK